MVKLGMMISDRYEILEKVGSGGMAAVFRAKCHRLNRFVAIKFLKQEYCQDTKFVTKFRGEAQSVAGLSHPNIVSIYDKKDFHLASGEDVKIIQDLSAREEEFSKMWQDFYKMVAIKERKNEKCRRNFMPKKYWPYLLEVRDEL